MKAVLRHQERRKWFVLVLAVLMAMSVALPAATTAQEPEAPCPEMAPLHRAEMGPPDSCGVPLGGPFGKDAEILLDEVQYELYKVTGTASRASLTYENEQGGTEQTGEVTTGIRQQVHCRVESPPG